MSSLASEQVSLMERAFEVARAGTVKKLTELADMLVAEGYFDIRAHIAGSPTLRHQLRSVIREARIATRRE